MTASLMRTPRSRFAMWAGSVGFLSRVYLWPHRLMADNYIFLLTSTGQCVQYSNANLRQECGGTAVDINDEFDGPHFERQTTNRSSVPFLTWSSVPLPCKRSRGDHLRLKFKALPQGVLGNGGDRVDFTVGLVPLSSMCTDSTGSCVLRQGR